MFLTTGTLHEVTANVSGPIAELMPAEVGSVIQYQGVPFKIYQPGADVNTLTHLIAGEKYHVYVTSDVEVPAFGPYPDLTVADNKTLLFRLESEDNNFGDLPAVFLANYTTALVKLDIVGMDGDGYKASRMVRYTLSVDDTGAITNELDEAENTFGDIIVNLTLTTNRFVVRIKSEGDAVDTVKWAVKMEILSITFQPLT